MRKVCRYDLQEEALYEQRYEQREKEQAANYHKYLWLSMQRPDPRFRIDQLHITGTVTVVKLMDALQAYGVDMTGMEYHPTEASEHINPNNRDREQNAWHFTNTAGEWYTVHR